MMTFVDESTIVRVLFAVLACWGGRLWADEAPYLEEDLQLWLRADKGLETDEQGVVTAWRNQGALGAALDMTPATAGGIVYNPQGMNGQPSLSFDGVQYLQSAQATTCGLTSEGGAWFVVFKPGVEPALRSNMAIFGTERGVRFGAFFPNFQNDTTGFMTGSFFYDLNTTHANVSDDPQVLTAMQWSQADGSFHYSMHNAYISEVGNNTSSPIEELLYIGQMCTGWMSPFKGEIAEVRVYNRPLTRTERSRIQFELCARYGIRWDGHGMIDQYALRHYANSVQFGHCTGEGVPEEGVFAATNDFLTFTVDDPDMAFNETCGFLTHDGGMGDGRTWYVSTYGGVRGKAAHFTFDVSGRPLETYSLFKITGEETKVATAVRTGDTVTFTLPGGTWDTGFYRMCAGEDLSLAAWYRADLGVETNAQGEVTAWRNMGSEGDRVDVVPASAEDASHVKLVDGALNGCAVAAFDGGGWLQSTNRTSFGCKMDDGASWFVVYRPSDDVASRQNQGPFGFSDPNDDAWRWGAFFPWLEGDTGRKIACYQYTSSQYPLMIDVPNGWQILSHSRWRDGAEGDAVARNFVNGEKSGITIYSRYTPWSAVVTLGHLGYKDWCSPLKGEIAELRLYNHSLTAAERALVEITLAARYGIAVTTAGMNGVPDAAYVGDAGVIGSGHDLGRAGVPMSVTSGGCTLAFTEQPTERDGTLTYFAHDGGAWYASDDARGRSERSWFASTEATGFSFTLSFALTARALRTYTLLYRDTADGAWRKVADCPGTGTGEVSFPLATLARGYYTLDVTPAGTLFILK